MSLVSIVIVNWNGAEILPECLRSLLRLNHNDIEIVIVDNGSTDGSVDIVREICGGGVKIVRLEKNVGFAAGVNIGVENASGEFIARYRQIRKENMALFKVRRNMFLRFEKYKKLNLYVS